MPSSSCSQSAEHDGFAVAMESMHSPPRVAQRPSSSLESPAIGSAHSSHSNIPVALGRFDAELSPPVAEPWVTTPPSQKHNYVDLSEAEAIDDVELHVPVVGTHAPPARVSPPSTAISPASPAQRRRSQLSKVETANGADEVNGLQALQALDLDAVAGEGSSSGTQGSSPDMVASSLALLGNEARAGDGDRLKTGYTADIDDSVDDANGLGHGLTEASRTNLV